MIPEERERFTRIEAIQKKTARHIEHLGNALVELTEAHTRTEGALTRLADARTHGDARLDALIDIVRGEKGTGQ